MCEDENTALGESSIIVLWSGCSGPPSQATFFSVTWMTDSPWAKGSPIYTCTLIYVYTYVYYIYIYIRTIISLISYLLQILQIPLAQPHLLQGGKTHRFPQQRSHFPSHGWQPVQLQLRLGHSRLGDCVRCPNAGTLMTQRQLFDLPGNPWQTAFGESKSKEVKQILQVKNGFHLYGLWIFDVSC